MLSSSENGNIVVETYIILEVGVLNSLQRLYPQQ